jgi:CopG family transcriptional regulator, nickel-responsive regulator
MPRHVVRTGVSLPPEELRSLDRWAASRNAGNRSEAIRFLVQKELAESALKDPAADAVCAVLLLYNHAKPGVQHRLTEAEHRWKDHIRSAAHIHLEGGICVEILGLAGQRGELVRAAEDLRGVKGVSQGDYVLAHPQVAGGSTGHRHPHA